MNRMKYRLLPPVGVANGPQTFECTSSKGVVVRLTFVRMNFCLCFACMHTSHIASSWVNPSIRDRRAVGCRCANRRCHNRDLGIDVIVDAVTLGVGADCRTSTMDLFLFFSLDLPVETDVVGNGVVAVAGSGAAFSDAYVVASVVVFTIYRSRTLVPEMKIPSGDDAVNAPRPNVERAPAQSS